MTPMLWLCKGRGMKARQLAGMECCPSVFTTPHKFWKQVRKVGKKWNHATGRGVITFIHFQSSHATAGPLGGKTSEKMRDAAAFTGNQTLPVTELLRKFRSEAATSALVIIVALQRNVGIAPSSIFLRATGVVGVSSDICSDQRQSSTEKNDFTDKCSFTHDHYSGETILFPVSIAKPRRPLFFFRPVLFIHRCSESWTRRPQRSGRRRHTESLRNSKSATCERQVSKHHNCLALEKRGKRCFKKKNTIGCKEVL